MRRALLPCLFVLFLGAAHADVVHLTTGRAIKGTIIDENEDEVVVKTPKGKLTLPRRLVAKIVRQSKGRTYLELARQRVASADFDAAEGLYKRAAREGSKDVVDAAKEELRQLGLRRKREDAAERERAAAREDRVHEALHGDETEHGKFLALGGGPFTRTVRAREVVIALRAGHGKKALGLLDEVKTEHQGDASFAYLYARALHVSGRQDKAKEIYLQLLKGTPATSRMSATWLGEAVRRGLAMGGQFHKNAPGIGNDWKRLDTRHFVIYHVFDKVESWFTQAPEDAMKHVLKTFGIREDEVRLAGKIQLFIFKDANAYQGGGGMQLAGGHATTRLAPDGYFRSISTYARARSFIDTYRHEIAHTVFHATHPSLSSWAHEGAADHVTRQQYRSRHAGRYLGQREQNMLLPLERFLRDEQPRGSNQLAVAGYYAYASMVFETLVKETGSSRAALDLCVEIQRLGPERALKDAGLTIKKLEAAVVARAKGA